MKRVLKIIAIFLFFAFAALQFVRPDFGSPAISSGDSLLASADLPDEVGKILRTSCKDCHSNESVYPWYSQVAPVSWWLAGHIKHAREELNFSVWNTYSPTRKIHKLGEICEIVEAREMPLPSYLWAHWDAKLSDQQIELLCDWTKQEMVKLNAETDR